MLYDDIENPLAHRRSYHNESSIIHTPNREALPISSSISEKIFQFIIEYLRYIYLHISTFLHKPKQQEHQDEILPVCESTPVLDSDIEIVAINTNIEPNSILEESQDEISTGELNPNPINVLQELALNRLHQHQQEYSEISDAQYGTDLSIAYTKPRRNIIKPTTIPANYNTTILDIPNDDYKKSILNYYIPSKPISLTSYSILDNFLSDFYIDGISNIYKTTHDKIQDVITTKRLDSISKITPLTSDQLAHVYNSWRSTNPHEIFASNFQIEIMSKDLQTLQDGQWLNDNVIDYYLNLIMKDNPKVFAWTTHFYTTLESKGYKGVERWAKRKKLNSFEKDLVLVPVNISRTHWALAVIDNVNKKITYYDSLDSQSIGNTSAVSNLNQYMKLEANRLGRESIEYELVPHFKNTPQQNNGSDCGVFTCTAAKYLASGKNLNYGQKDMKIIRRRMTFEIINNHLLN